MAGGIVCYKLSTSIMCELCCHGLSHLQRVLHRTTYRPRQWNADSHFNSQL